MFLCVYYFLLLLPFVVVPATVYFAGYCIPTVKTRQFYARSKAEWYVVAGTETLYWWYSWKLIISLCQKSNAMVLEYNREKNKLLSESILKTYLLQLAVK